MKNFGLLSIAIVLLFSINIKAQEINVFPGFWKLEYYEDDVQISKEEFEKLLIKNQEANTYWLKTKRKRGLVFATLVSQTGFFIWLLQEDFNGANATAPFIGAIGSSIAGLVFLNQSNKSFKKTILEYNKGFDKKVSLNVGANNNGLGLELQF